MNKIVHVLLFFHCVEMVEQISAELEACHCPEAVQNVQRSLQEDSRGPQVGGSQMGTCISITWGACENSGS